MRVISGSARGKKLKTVSTGSLRPTASVVKEAAMNIIQFRIVGAQVLDLFAGTGQVAIELLSRGAQSAVLVDNDSTAIKTITQNLKETRLAERARVIKTTATAFLECSSGEFDIIFLDPPYGKEIIPAILPKVTKLLGKDGIIICETDRKDELPNMVGDYEKSKDYAYGSRKLNLYNYYSGNA